MVRTSDDGGPEPGIAPGVQGPSFDRLSRIVFDNLPSGRVFVLDRDGCILAAGGARTLTGVPVEGIVGLRASELLDAAEYSRFEPALRAALAGQSVHREGNLRGVDVEYWLQPVHDDRGQVEMVVATGQNVSDRMRLGRELRQERERLERVLDGSSDGYGEWDVATGLCRVSRRWNEILGRDPGAAVLPREEWLALVHPDDLAAVTEEATAALEGTAERMDVEHRVRRADGSWAWVRTRGKVVARDAQGKPSCFAGTLTDITRYRLAAEDRRAALVASEARYRSLHESMMDGFAQVGMDGVIQETNEVYRQMLGYGPAELATLTYSQITPERWHEEEARIVRDQVLPRGYSDVYEKEYRRKDGSVFPVELRTFLLREKGKPVGMWAIVRDLTARNALREQLATGSRLAALGTLVAGVAHEINNPLAAEIASEGYAIGAIEDLLERLHSGHPPERRALADGLVEILEALRDAQASGLRISRIVKDMAAFARPEAVRGRSTLAEVVEKAVRWMPPATRERLHVRVEDAGPVETGAPSGVLAQVVVNLLDNAANATEEGKKGEVTVRIGPGPADRAWLEVEDDGVGMAPEVMARIFDPFFSTRRPGSGPGLGLSTVHSLVRAVGGNITVRSAPGKGTTFRVELPVAVPPTAERAKAGEQEA